MIYLLPLLLLTSTYSFRPNPSFALTNFEGLIMNWCASSISFTQSPSRPAGICQLRWKENDYKTSIIDSDGFAFTIGTQNLTNPLLFVGSNSIEETGEYFHKLKKYNDKDITGVKIHKSFLAVPNKYFILENYLFENTGDKDEDINILDFLITPDPGYPLTGKLLSDNKTLYVDFSSPSSEYKNLYLAIGMVDASSFTFKNNMDDILKLFDSQQSLDNVDSISNNIIGGAYQKKFVLQKGKTQNVMVYRAIADSVDALENLQKEILTKSYDQWKAVSKDFIKQKFDTFRTPTFANDSERKMWYSSVLTLLFSQNPTIGTLVASFHPKYENKVWTRDASYASIILIALGDYPDAKKYLKWLSTAEKRELGNLATCYNWFSGNVVGFVEPQYDSVGASLAAYYYYYKMSNQSDLFEEESVKNTINIFENFLLYRDYKNLIRPDYSIWEESSDGWTGKALPVQYFAFTQIQSHFGIRCAAMIEQQIYKNETRAAELNQRAEDLAKGFDENFWNEAEEFYVEAIWSDTKLQKNVIDSALSTMMFTDIVKNKYRIKKHLDKIRSELTKLDYGIARYFYDPYFFESKFNPAGKEVFEASPPW